jgi:hypothetical protein
MVLHSEERKLAMANSLDRSIVQIQVCHLQRRRAGHAVRIANHSETMVLGGDEHLIVAEVTYGMIPASMTVGQFGRTAAVGETHELVPQADAERRQATPGELANGVERVADCGRIAGAVGKKETLRLQLPYRRGRCAGRYYGYPATSVYQHPHDISFHAEIVRYHMGTHALRMTLTRASAGCQVQAFH